MHSVVVTMIWLVSMADSIRRLIHQIAMILKEDVMTNVMEGEIIQQTLHATRPFETNGAPIASQLGYDASSDHQTRRISPIAYQLQHSTAQHY
ncbi:hypothetical protein J3F84DRAFT_377759 [Trichoderma pleuroticola]